MEDIIIYPRFYKCATLAEFKENMIKAFNSKNNKHHANNKLQQMYLITKILSLKESFF